MAKRLFVGSLPWSVNDAKLSEIFSQFGTVVYAKVMQDRETGRSRGFGFVEMETDQQADEAIKALDGSDMEGRKIVVNEAKPSERN